MKDTEDFSYWEFVNDGSNSYVGKVREDVRDIVTLDPCFEYISQLVSQPVRGGIAHVRIRTMQPIDSGSSVGCLRIRWTSRRLVSDLDKTDKSRFEKMYKDALLAQNQAKLEGGRIIPASIMAGGRNFIGSRE